MKANNLALTVFALGFALLALAAAGRLGDAPPPAAGSVDVQQSGAQVEGEHVVYVPLIASDGPLPTPTPTPVPGAVAECMSPRATDSAALPAGDDSVFRNCQVIAYYGHPAVPALGVLGAADRAAMIARLRQQAAAYDAVNGSRGVILSFHLIWAVAQPAAHGDAISRMADSMVDEWIAQAEEHDFLIILDLQMGHSSIAAEVERVLPFLRNPRVHLALDPEWTMPEGYVPGQIIGWMTAAQINEAQAMLQTVITEHGLPNKLLVVHQFTPGMIRDKHLIEDHADVDLVIDMDGFGGPALKRNQYHRFVRDDNAEHAGIKLSYTLDSPLLSPAEVMALEPEPDFVVYQ